MSGLIARMRACARRVFQVVISLFYPSSRFHSSPTNTSTPDEIIFREHATSDGPYFTTETDMDNPDHPHGWPSGWKW